MGQLMTPICDRCGQRGAEGHSFAQIKFISRQGTIRVLDLCPECECRMAEWIEKTDERGNADGTD